MRTIPNPVPGLIYANLTLCASHLTIEIKTWRYHSICLCEQGLSGGDGFFGQSEFFAIHV